MYRTRCDALSLEVLELRSTLEIHQSNEEEIRGMLEGHDNNYPIDGSVATTTTNVYSVVITVKHRLEVQAATLKNVTEQQLEELNKLHADHLEELKKA